MLYTTCAACGSGDIAALAGPVTCYSCGAVSTWDGAVAREPREGMTSTATVGAGALADKTVTELRSMASEAEIAGRSSMDKDELIAALGG